MTKSPVARLRNRLPNEKGVSTAEYAVVTAAGAGFGGLLYKLLSSEFGSTLIKSLFDMVMGWIGLK